MKNLIIAGLVVAGSTAASVSAMQAGKAPAAPALEALSTYTFDDFVKGYGKAYTTTEERSRRESIFNENMKTIRAHNANPKKSFTMNVNHMADWTPAQFKALMGQTPTSQRNGLWSKLPVVELPPLPKTGALPDSIDWRQKGVVTAVKDQGQCGGCWAFSCTETMESHWALATGQLYELSTQQVISCTPNPDQCGGTGGCEGATENLGFQYIIGAGGMVTAKAWPFSGTDGTCTYPPNAERVANFSSIVKVKTNDQDDMMNIVANKGPVSIGIWADPIQFYAGGVFNGCDYTQNMDIDHAVQLVGYGTDSASGLDYWIVRNSWGVNWGESGYIRMQRDKVAQCGMDTTPKDGSACKNDPNTPVKVCGQCGLLYESSYAVPKV